MRILEIGLVSVFILFTYLIAFSSGFNRGWEVNDCNNKSTHDEQMKCWSTVNK